MGDWPDKEANFTPILDPIQKDIPTRTVVGITCALSIIGSLLIILSYLLQKKKTKVREILVNVSLMDLGVGLSNLIGLSVYFDQYYDMNGYGGKPVPTYIDNLCKTQAFFAAYCSLGSIFWTTALAGYLYAVVHSDHCKKKHFLCLVRFYYAICYAIPLVISVWLVSTGRLGYSPYDSSGWCSLIAKDPYTKKVNLFITVFAHDLWMYLSMILIIVLYVAIKCSVTNQVKGSQTAPSKKSWSSLNLLDYKFIAIPVIFVLLRIWSLILSILLDYAQLKTKNIPLIIILFYLSGIGDSAQGFTNAILFILFTKTIRNNILRYVLCCKYKRSKQIRREQSLNDVDSQEDIIEDPSTSEDEKMPINSSITKTPLLHGTPKTSLH